MTVRTALALLAVPCLAALATGVPEAAAQEKTFEPMDCSEVPDRTPHPPGGKPARIYIDGQGNLAVDPPEIRRNRGGKVQWIAPGLRWTVEFHGGSPLPAHPKRVPGSEPGTPGRPATTADITGDPQGCGRYSYSVTAYRPNDPNTIYTLDPPIWIW